MTPLATKFCVGSAAVLQGRGDSQLQTLFDKHVATCTMQNWKYFVFSRLMRPLLESFDRSESTKIKRE